TTLFRSCLTICGTISPTKPIGPAIETEVPANTMTKIPMIILINLTFWPNEVAKSSPNSMIVNCLDMITVQINASINHGKIPNTCVHVIEDKDPTNQNITVDVASSFNKIIPCVILEKNKWIAIPASANLIGVIPLVEPDKA